MGWKLWGKPEKELEQPQVLDPNAVPSGSGGKRANNIPLLLIILVVFIFLAIVAYVAFERSNSQLSPTEKEENRPPKENRSATQMANELTSGWGGTVVIPTEPSPPATDEEKAHTTRDAAPNKTFADLSLVQKSAPDPYLLEHRMRVQELKVQALEAARTSATRVHIELEKRPAPTAMDVNARIAATRQRLADMSDPSAAYQARLAQLRGESPESTDALYEPTRSGKNDVRQFTQKDSWNLDSQVEGPASPYMIRAGFVIPATMISGINSDLPGQVMAQVSQNVYDTATGKYLLIPQGTRLIGAYSSDVAFGQERVLMAWQRLIFPDGKALDIRAMPGADSAGYAGFSDKVNSHWFRTISSAVLMSGVIAAVDMSQNDRNSDSNNDRQRASDSLSEALGQTLGQTLSQIITKNLNISPTLEIRPGYRFNVMVVKDMSLPGSYRAFDY